jgi:hypothetical protein
MLARKYGIGDAPIRLLETSLVRRYEYAHVYDLL